MKVVGWEVLGTLVLAALYLVLPGGWRRVDTFKALALNVAFAIICLAGLIAVVTNVNGYTPARLGVGLAYLGPAGRAAGVVTVFGLCALLALARARGHRPVVTANLLKLLLAYPAWAYVQHLLVMGIFMNLVADWLGMPAAVIIGGGVFGVIHWGDHEFFLLTATIGLLWAWSFLSYPNLLPLALSHGILATAHGYWVKGEDRWAHIFERTLPGTAGG